MAHSARILVALMCLLFHSTSPQCLTDNDAAIKISAKGAKDLLQSQLRFSADLLQAVGSLQPEDNIFLSPYSVFNSLLLAYFAAGNETEDSLKQVLSLPEDQEKIDTLGAYCLEKSNQINRSIKGSENYRLSSANRIYVSEEQKVRPCIKKLFMDEIQAANFGENLTDTIKSINNWVSKQTRGNIEDLLSPDSINSNTNLVLVNAAYFRGFWKYQFSPSETREAEFILANGTSVPVTMMSVESKFSHRIDEMLGIEVLELPYQGDTISMFILTPLNPSETAITELLNKTDAATLMNIVESSSITGEVSVVIPKFSIEQTLELTPILESMGLGDLFQDSADLNTLTGEPGLKVDAAIHKAKITVDETGTEAAAATAIFANRFAADSFVANHPFVFFLFEKKSNILLFVGIFNSPKT